MSDRTIQVYRDEELESLPDPEWLVEGFLPAKGLVVLFGAQGSGKSFVALDWAMNVAAGMKWQDAPTLHGPVLYIAAEGHAGYKKRVRAWKTHASVVGGTEHGCFFVGAALDFHDAPTVEALASTIEELGVGNPRLIVVDTLARCMSGDENLASDMNRFIAACDRLKERFECCVMVVHHTGWEGSHERGSTALPGAADTRVFVERSGLRKGRFRCEKQKDAEPFGTAHFMLRTVGESCIVDIIKIEEPQESSEPTEYELEILKVLSRVQDVGSYGYVKSAVQNVPPGSVSRILKSAAHKGFVAHNETSKLYSLTDLGKRFLPRPGRTLQLVKTEDLP